MRIECPRCKGQMKCENPEDSHQLWICDCKEEIVVETGTGQVINLTSMKVSFLRRKGQRNEASC